MDYRTVIESRYNRGLWQDLLHDIFKSGAQFRETPITVNANSPLAASSLQLGTITLADDNKIAVYEIKLSDSVDIVANRVGIRNLLHNDWKLKGCVGAFMFCYRDNESVLRFSYVSSTFKFNEEGKMERDETDTKRYTYLLGAGHRSRTAIKQFEDLKNSKLMLADLTKAFSLEALSDRFFKDYKRIYEDIIEYVTGKRIVKIANKWEERTISTPNKEIMTEFSKFADPEKAVRDYVKNLMGRIVFLQFIQKKGWLGVPVNKEWGEGDKEFLQNLYERSCKDDFIDGVLEVLFTDINTKRDNDLASSILGFNIKVPYLNGGLFQRDKADDCSFKLPKKQLDEMFKFFSSYNFTIDENDPEDAEIGVDPEMLGHIFENLLEDNKDKGAFYTPKEIVQYMCRESLIAYLQTNKSDDDKKAIRTFVTTYNPSILNTELREEVDTKLKDVKICDPAIGSGAFPMGLLKELYACRSTLEGLSDDNAAEIKKHIIQNSIYGVDIEKGAVDIARLRFWLSIIVDEKTPHALPNMDFKIMQGNSLIPTFDGKYVNLTDKLRHVNSSKIRDSKKKLFALQQEFYNSEGYSKLELLIQIKLLILEIVKLQMDYEYRQEVANSAETMDLFNPQPLKEVKIDEDKRRIVAMCLNLQRELSSPSKTLAEKSSMEIPFFDWKIMFSDVFQSDSEGFDIVVGNPPYISAPGQLSVPSLASQRETIIATKQYSTLCSKWDLYIPFMELGYKHLCKENGVFSMIVPLPSTNQIYGKEMRKLLLSEFNLIELVDLKGVKIFDNATVTNCIYFVQKNKPTGSTRISKISENLTIYPAFVQSHEALEPEKKNRVWNLEATERDVNRHKDLNVLGDFCYISYGLRPNSDEKIAKGEFKKDDLISLTFDEIHCRKYFEAKDLAKYAIKRVRYLEYNTERSPAKFARPTFPELYLHPKVVVNTIGEIHAHYDEQQIIHNHSLTSVVLWKDLEGIVNKSITSSIKKFSRFPREKMEDLSNSIDLKYILGLLNSKYMMVVLNKERGDAINIYPETLRNLPIPLASKEVQTTIATLVDRIIEIKQDDILADTSKEELEIDNLVYNLYNIPTEERE